MWLGYIGSGDSARLHGALGAGSKTLTGSGYGIGVNPGRIRAGDPADLSADAYGTIRAHFPANCGDDVEAGCSAVVDPTNGSVRLRRDPFGLYSVYYAYQCCADRGGVLWFGSDLRALVSALPDKPELNLAAVHGYLAFSYVPNPETLFRGIQALPAGCLLTGSAAGTRIETAPSWAADEPFGGTEEQAEQELRVLLKSAVRRRVVPGSRVGVYLSGGLDSSLIAAMLVECGVEPHLYTLDLGPEANGDDLTCARQAAQHLGCQLTIVPARGEDILRILPMAAKAMDQPFGDAVVPPLLLMGEAAAGKIDVVFNGEGGDQLFGGWANKPMIAAEIYGSDEYSRESGYLQTFHRFLDLTGQLYSPVLRDAASTVKAGDWLRRALIEGGYPSLLHQLRAANLALKGAQNIAPRAVQAASAYGLALRSPFFDYALTRWSFRLPPEWLLRGACEKYLLKRVAEAYLPPNIVWREKRGMGVPVTEWCLGPLRSELARTLHKRRLLEDGLFEPHYVERLRRGEDSPGEFRRRRIGEKLWTLAMFQMWHKEHIQS